MTNCALMGVRWQEQTWWSYQAMLIGWNDAHSDKPSRPVRDVEPGDTDRLARAMRAHGI